jgi:hypothetical protein
VLTSLPALAVLPWQQLRGFMFHYPQKIADSRSTREHHETLESLKTLVKVTNRYNRGLIMESQLARWQDLRDGGSFGIAVKLFFVTLGKVLRTSSLKISQHDLYIDAFQTITSSWKMCRDTGRSRLSSTLFLTSLCDSSNFRPSRLRFRLSEGLHGRSLGATAQYA